MTKAPPQLRTHAERIAHAKLRFSRLMKFSLLISIAVLIAAFSWLYATNTPMPLPFIGAIVVAVVGSLMLTAALMGLVFFSSASGADDQEH